MMYAENSSATLRLLAKDTDDTHDDTLALIGGKAMLEKRVHELQEALSKKDASVRVLQGLVTEVGEHIKNLAIGLQIDMNNPDFDLPDILREALERVGESQVLAANQTQITSDLDGSRRLLAGEVDLRQNAEARERELLGHMRTVLLLPEDVPREAVVQTLRERAEEFAKLIHLNKSAKHDVLAAKAAHEQAELGDRLAQTNILQASRRAEVAEQRAVYLEDQIEAVLRELSSDFIGQEAENLPESIRMLRADIRLATASLANIRASEEGVRSELAQLREELAVKGAELQKAQLVYSADLVAALAAHKERERISAEQVSRHKDRRSATVARYLEQRKARPLRDARQMQENIQMIAKESAAWLHTLNTSIAPLGREVGAVKNFTTIQEVLEKGAAIERSIRERFAGHEASQNAIVEAFVVAREHAQLLMQGADTESHNVSISAGTVARTLVSTLFAAALAYKRATEAEKIKIEARLKRLEEAMKTARAAAAQEHSERSAAIETQLAADEEKKLEAVRTENERRIEVAADEAARAEAAQREKAVVETQAEVIATALAKVTPEKIAAEEAMRANAEIAALRPKYDTSLAGIRAILADRLGETGRALSLRVTDAQSLGAVADEIIKHSTKQDVVRAWLHNTVTTLRQWENKLSPRGTSV
jgi:hypothetical protein